MVPLMYSWNSPPLYYSWAPHSEPCCSEGPGYDPAAAVDGSLPGKWWRYELVLTKVDGSKGAAIKVYRKNVTKGAVSPEYKIIDTTVGCTDCGDANQPAVCAAHPGLCEAGDPNTIDWLGERLTGLQPLSPVSGLVIEKYRAGVCAGFTGFTHSMIAGFQTALGQRIGPAAEVEGDLSATAPAAPTGLNVQ